MMFFIHPYYLWFLLLPIALFLFSLKESRNQMEQIFSPKILKKITLTQGALRPLVRYRYFLIVLMLFIIALARPLLPQKNLQLTQTKSSLVIALDISKSMQKTDIYPTRLALAKKKLLQLLQKANGMDIGILLFSEDAYMLYPLTQESATLEYLFKQTKITQNFKPNTNLFAAIEGAQKMLQKRIAKNILLLSDCAEDIQRNEEARYLKKHNIRLSIIAFTPKVNRGAKELANASGGIYEQYSFSNSDVNALIKHIQNHAQKQNIHYNNTENYQELFLYPLALATFLLFVIFLPSLELKPLLKSLLIPLLLHTLLMPKETQAGMLDFIALHKAKKAYTQKRYKDAIRAYETLQPTKAIEYNLANAYYMLHQFTQAITHYKKSVGADAAFNSKIYHNIANCYAQKGKLETAQFYYKKALALHAYPQTKKNLLLLTQELHNRKKLKKLFLNGVAKLCLKNRLEGKQESSISSNYHVVLKHLVRSEEEKWIHKILAEKQSAFLEKITTQRSSRDSKKPW